MILFLMRHQRLNEVILKLFKEIIYVKSDLIVLIQTFKSQNIINKRSHLKINNIDKTCFLLIFFLFVDNKEPSLLINIKNYLGILV